MIAPTFSRFQRRERWSARRALAWNLAIVAVLWAAILWLPRHF